MTKQTGAGAMMSEELEVGLAKVKVPKEVIDALKLAMLHSDCDGYAQSYAHGMTTSFHQFGIPGVKFQVMYLLLNMGKWRGEDARNAKKLLRKWSSN